MTKRIGLIGIAAIVVALGLTAWRLSGSSSAVDEGSVAEVSRRDLSAAVTATGTIRPQVGAEVKVGSRVSGVLRKLHFNIGEQVNPGDLIAELDDRDLRARVSQAEAELAAAEARLALVRAGSRQQERAQARHSVEDAAATHALAESQFKRQTQLFDKGLLPQNDLDIARKALDGAEAKLRSSREQLALVENRYQPEDVLISEAQVRQARASLEVARTQLSYTRILAPIGGVIASVSTQEGEAISAGLSAPTFVTVVDLGRLQADAFVDETDIGRIQPGQEAYLTVDAYPDREFRGTVAAVLPKATIQQNVVYYDTVIELEPSEGLLRPDMTANVTIRVGQRAGVLVVPNQAVRREDGQRVVYVMTASGPARRVVKVGWRDGGFTEITSGLQEKERVLLGPLPAGQTGRQ
jgi:multidrug efflux pump subunit AcrA (membrane-fusion protein)